MNEIYLGERAYGFAAAANIYFNKSLTQLTLAESAMLAGLPKAPSAYNPMINAARARERQQYILRRMLALGAIDDTAYQRAITAPLTLAARGSIAVREAAYAVEEARLWAIKRYGDDTYTMGLDVTLTLDMPKQRAADAALRDELVTMQNERGYIGPEAKASLPHGPRRSTAIRQALARHPDSGAYKSAIITMAGATEIQVVMSDRAVVTMPRRELRIDHRPLTNLQQAQLIEGAILRVIELPMGHWELTQLPAIEGAIASLDVQSGAIIAMVGGFDYHRSQYDHAIQAYRQPGSAFKPFVYSAAIEKGYFPGTLIDDRQRRLNREETGANPWMPRNFSRRYDGFVTMREALVHSKNMATVSLMQAAGAQYVQQFAIRFGFEGERNHASLPLALGAGSVTPMQLAAAFNVFASGGYHRAPYLVARVTRRSGEILFDGVALSVASTRRVISDRNAWLTDNLLRSVVDHGSGRGALSLGRGDLAGKTGTSNEARDAWFSGYGGGIVTTVWVGYDQPKSLGRRSGAVYALPIWKRYMMQALRDRPEQIPLMPKGLRHDGDDYIYSEYPAKNCIPDISPFVRTAYQCTTQQMAEMQAADLVQKDADERADIVELFSTPF